MCNVCQKYRHCNTREPIKQHEVPDYPWLKLGADLFHFGNKDYLLVVDYYSKFPEVSCLNTKSAQSVILALKPILARNGIPEALVADNMPFASVEFRTFAKQCRNFHVVISSPHYPKSNGEAEKYVGIVKMILRKCCEDNSDPNLALLRYRNTPITSMKYSPAQMLFNRRLRDDIPINKELLIPELASDAKPQLVARQEQQAAYYNRNVKQKLEFENGESVRVKFDKKSNWVPAVVENKHLTPRSYVITSEDGRTVRHNKSMINKTSENVVVNPPYPPNVIESPVSQARAQLRATAIC